MVYGDFLDIGSIAMEGGLGVPAVSIAGVAEGYVQPVSRVRGYAAQPYAGSAIQQMLSGATPTVAPGEEEVAMAGFPIAGLAAAIPAAAGALGMALPAWLLAALGLAGGGYAAYQALGGGEGEGLFGLNILGGDGFTMGGVPFGGPGLAEPTVPYKEWHITTNGTTLQFYRVSTARGSRMFCYNNKTKKWTTWVPTKMAVIGKNLPSHRTLTRMRKYLSRHTVDARTILKITSPKSLRQARHYRRH